jgi:DNA-binding transcriptional LysR family regulator
MNIPGSLDLRCVVAVAEEASFTDAGRRAHVAQQVLSAQVRQLEDAVGFQLLRRTSRDAAVMRMASSYRGWCHSWRV